MVLASQIIVVLACGIVYAVATIAPLAMRSVRDLPAVPDAVPDTA